MWIADSGVSCHMTHNNSKMYDIGLPSPGREVITISDRRGLRVGWIESIDIMFHGYTDERATLTDISYIPGLGFNLYSAVHSASRTSIVIVDALGAHIIGTKGAFPRNTSGSYLDATRHPARTVEAKGKTENVRAIKL